MRYLTRSFSWYSPADQRASWRASGSTPGGTAFFRGVMRSLPLGIDTSVNSPFSSRVLTVVPTGQRRYQYLDPNVYRPAVGGMAPGSSGGPLGGPFTYRLTVRSASGDQSYSTLLVGTPSAVQRSWGTIKSMFR